MGILGRGDRATRELGFVVPVFNERECLPHLVDRLCSLRERLAGELTIRCTLVNDGSSDGTAGLLDEYARIHPWISVIHFSRNFGHQAAVSAGLDHAYSDWVCIVDADLQDPPELAVDMLALADSTGANTVYARRNTRLGESRSKLLTAKIFYKVLRFLCDVDIPPDTGDFRLVDQKVLSVLRQMPERHRFLRGMFPWIGFKSVGLGYDRDARHAGETKYPMKKMLALAATAVMSFSDKPLRIGSYLGIGVVGSGFIVWLYILILKFTTNSVVPGLAAILGTILIVGGLQIGLLGIIGQYLGRSFEEKKEQK